MTTLDKSHRFNESTLNKKLDELDAWLQEIAPSPLPVAKKPVVHPANFNDSMYISEGSAQKSRNHLPPQTRHSQGALEAILSGPPPVNERKPTNHPKDNKDARRSKTSRFRRSSSSDKLRTMKEHSNESLSANGPRGGEGSGGDDQTPEDKPNIIQRNRSNERLSTSAQRGEESGKDERSAGSEDSAIGRVKSNERLSTNGQRRNDELSAKSEHSTIRRATSNGRLSTSVQRGGGGSRQDELSAGSEHGINVRRNRSSERLSTTVPLSSASSNTDEALPGKIRRTSDPEDLLSRRRNLKEKMTGDMQGKTMRRIGSNGSLSRKDNHSPVMRTKRDLLGGSEHISIRRIGSNDRLSKRDNSSPGSGSNTSGNEQGLTRRIRSTENLFKSDKRSPRRPSNGMEHNMTRRRSSSTRNFAKGDQLEPTRSKDDLGFILNSQAPQRRYSRASSQKLLKSTEQLSPNDSPPSKVDISPPVRTSTGRENKRRNDLSRSEHGTKPCHQPPVDSPLSRPKSERNLMRDDGDGRRSRSSSGERPVGVTRARRIGRLADKSSSQHEDGNDELKLQECVTSGEDKHHQISNNPRRVVGRPSKVGTKRSPKPSNDGYRGRGSGSRPSAALTRALSVGNFFITRCDSSEELAVVSKPRSTLGLLDMQ